MNPHEEKIKLIKSLVESGKLSTARGHLRDLTLRRIPAADRLPYALWARRSGAPDVALKILNPHVHPDRGHWKKAAPAEIAEYGASLVKVGAVDEALALLEALDPDAHPEALLFRAYGLISRWNYRAAIPLLEQYVRHRLDPYQFLIGRLNLASAYINQNHAATGPLLESLLRETEERQLFQLKGNAEELMGQWGLMNQDVPFARHHLNLAKKTLEKIGGMDTLFVNKWLAVADLYDAKDPGPIKGIREQALRLHHWETVRDCDYHQAIHMKLEPLARQVYFGTPYESFRERIVQGLPELELPFRYSRPHARNYDVVTGEFSGGAHLRPSSLKYRLLAALSQDRYRPARVAALAREVYPGEHFNPFSTPGRIHVAINRLRQWLASHAPDCEVVFSGEGYRNHKFECTVYLDKEVGLVRLLGEKIGDRPFTAKEAASALNLSHRSTNRVLLEACEAGDVLSIGAGAKIRYEISPSRQNGKGDLKKLKKAS